MSDQGSTGGAPAPTSAPTTSAPANDNGTPPADAAPPEARHKIKVRGEEREVPLSELIKLAEKGGGAEKVFEEAAGMRKQVEALLRKLPEDTVGALEQLLGDKSRAAKTVLAQMWRDPAVRAEMEAYLVEQYQYEGLPEQERRKVDEDRDVRRKAAEYERLAKEDADRKRDAATTQYRERFTATFTNALAAEGLPAEPRTLAMMAQLAEAAINGNEKVTAAQLAQRVREELREIARGTVGSLDPEALAELLGEDKLGALRKRDVERLKPKAPAVERTRGNGKAAPEKRNGAPKSYASVLRRIRGEG